jgi:hypothetical protein
MNIRAREEPTPQGRLAAVVRDEMMRQLDAKPFGRVADYADFKEALERQVRIELLAIRIDEARRYALNDKRIHELLAEFTCLLTE